MSAGRSYAILLTCFTVKGIWELNIMSKYELALIIKPVLSEQEIEKYLTDLEKKIVSTYKGKIESQDRWGNRKLTYKIQGQNSGFYCFLVISLLSSEIKKLENKLSIDNNLLRYVISKI